MKPSRRNWPQQTTWVMRQLGAAFHPDTVCEYTGLALWLHPIASHPIPGIWPEPWAMGFWRADGHLRAVCRVTPEEFAWLSANPAQYAAEHAEFEAWRSSFTRKP
jgi:hypothetical protein